LVHPIPKISFLIPLLAVLASGQSHAWTPGTYPTPMHSRGFTVNTSDRNDVVAFWNAVYLPSEAYVTLNHFANHWNGNYLAGSPFTNAEGVNPAELVTHTERRVNFFRAMAGVPASAQLNTVSTVRIDGTDLHTPPVNTTKAAAAQRAAYMIVRTFGTNLAPVSNPNAALSHNPVAGSCVAWTTAAWNANHRGNLAQGFYGPGAIDSYISENVIGTSDWNNGVGHRRHLLNPGSTNFATGDTPGSYTPATAEFRPPTNVLYVIQKPDELTPGLTPFVAWPSAGFFPAPLNSRFWSLSRANANFSAATVSMTTDGGLAIPVLKQPVVQGFGDNTIVWQIPESERVTSVSADTRFHVTVSGITGTGVPASYSYSVTLIEPKASTGDQALIGSAAPPTTGVAKMLFNSPSNADMVQVNSFQPVSTLWTEGGEDATSAWVLDRRHSPASYALRATVNSFGGQASLFYRTGTKALRLTFPTSFDIVKNGPRDQIFELDRMIVPKQGAQLRYYSRQALMTSLTNLRVETSADDGGSWSALGSDVIGNIVINPQTGQVTSGTIDSGFILRTVSIPATDQPLRVRFRLFRSAFGIVYAMDQVNDAAFPTGVFIDDITTTNCDWLELKKSNDLPPTAKEIPFNATTAGVALANGQQWRLRLRAKLGNQWMPHGLVKSLTVTSTAKTGFDAWMEYENPDVTGGFTGDPDGDGVANGIEYAFGLDPRTPTPVADGPQVDGNFITLQRPLAAMQPGVTYGLEWSDNLTSWSTNGAQVNHAGGILTGRVPLGQGARFLRWKISKI